MENLDSFNIEINTSKQVLSSDCKIYKTERFFYQTKKLVGVDKFLLKIAENIAPAISRLVKMQSSNVEINAFKVSTLDRNFGFYIKLGSQIKEEGVQETDIIYVLAGTDFENAKTNDQRISEYLKHHHIFTVTIKPAVIEENISDYKKLYLLSESEYINFPMLSAKQKHLVEIENENVLVQGVAGSGKTNVCLSKIIWVACRSYTGKILYTTFSRGLLIDTKNKIEIFKNNIKNFISDYKNNRIVFLDKNHKKAIENRLGLQIIADNETNIIKKLEQIIYYLENKVDYLLIEDIYKNLTADEINMADEAEFVNGFLKNITNHQLKSRLEKIKNISYSIIYKEIYGMIFGSGVKDKLGLDDYKLRRENSFSAYECETIYGIAKLYEEYQKTQNLSDNNKISRKLLENTQKISKYSLSIIDEVQDFTEINLNLFKEISLKMFCVGDALQMINPSYFSFAYLKKLMYNEDVTSVTELECNYRNNQKIVEILDALSAINIEQFGTHSFVLSGESVDQNSLATAVYTTGEEFLNKLKSEKFENFTILVTDLKQKQELRKIFKRQEILTISEIKGLERDTVLLFNILTDNADKLEKLEQLTINHKQADENSVFRYYFNLFYVGVSRAKHNIFVFENKPVNIFKEFFERNFENLLGNAAYQKFADIVSKIEIDDDEILERINEFIKLGQFDNARFYASKFEDDFISNQQLQKIDAFEHFVFKGKNKEAGIKLWKAGLSLEAKTQFEISGDAKLIEFIDQLEGREGASLDASIVKFFVDFDDNDDAKQLIVDVIKQDLENIKNMHRDTKKKLKEFKEKYRGK